MYNVQPRSDIFLSSAVLDFAVCELAQLPSSALFSRWGIHISIPVTVGIVSNHKCNIRCSSHISNGGNAAVLRSFYADESGLLLEAVLCISSRLSSSFNLLSAYHDVSLYAPSAYKAPFGDTWESSLYVRVIDLWHWNRLSRCLPAWCGPCRSSVSPRVSCGMGPQV